MTALIPHHEPEKEEEMKLSATALIGLVSFIVGIVAERSGANWLIVNCFILTIIAALLLMHT